MPRATIVHVVVFWLTILSLVSGGAAAQDTDQVRALRQEVERLKSLVDALDARLTAVEQQAPDARPGPPAPEPQAAPARPGAQPEKTSQVAAYLQQLQTMRRDEVAAVRVDNLPIDPEMRGFVPLPGTDTVMRIGGYAKVDAIYDAKPAGDPDLFVTSTIPTGPTLGLNSFNLHVRQTRFNLDLRRPIASDDLRIFVESDFFGLTPNLFRMRHAYGHWRNLLIGQSFSTFMDVDALADTLDFEGPPNTVFVLQPQVRYTLPLTARQSLAVAIEKPTTEVRSQSVVTPRTPAPDGIVRWRYDGDRGHVQAATLFRSVAGYIGTEASETLFGWGVNLTGSLRVGKADNLALEGVYGRGLGRYVNDTAGLALEAGLDDGRVRALPLYGVNGAYTRAWTSRVRSTLTYGFLTVENVPSHDPDTFHWSQYASANVIFAPTSSFSVGAEVLYGRQEVKSGERGNATRVQVSLQYDLVRR